jgi:hypothetical protein
MTAPRMRLAGTGLPGRCAECDRPAVSGAEYCRSCLDSQRAALEHARSEHVQIARRRFDYLTPPLCATCGHLYEVAQLSGEPVCYGCLIEARADAEPESVEVA